MATSQLVLDASPEVVLAAGDNQHQKGEFDDYMQSFDPSWGRFKELIRPGVLALGLGSQGYSWKFLSVGDEFSDKGTGRCD